MTRPSIDRLRRASYVLAVFISALAPAACASAPAQQAAGAPADPAIAAAAVAATMPQRRLQIVFEWTMTDRDARFSGRGTMRIDTGYRARLDLFGPRGETLAATILTDAQMRSVPPLAGAMLPPPAMMWAALGIFRAPEDADLMRASISGGTTQLEYARGAIRWQFSIADGLLRSMEWTNGSARRTVQLTGTSSLGMPAEASFRDWTEFRQLTLKVTDVEEKASFEPDVWILPGER